MKKEIIFLMLASFIILLTLHINAQDEKGTIKIEVYGFENDDGMARILLFSTKEKESFPSEHTKAMDRKVVPIKNKKVIFEFKDLNYGDYAISVHHDVNNDGKVNTNFVGIPKEGLGASNDAKGFMGPPSFDKAKVSLKSKMLVLKINIVN